MVRPGGKFLQSWHASCPVWTQDRLTSRLAVSGRSEVCQENEGLPPGSPEDRKLRECIDGGFTALGKIMKLDRDSLYALYGIERAGILGRRVVIGERPWYPPGAKRLLDEQGRDGLWTGSYNAAVQSAFAILFLKKATAPITGR